MLEKVLLSFFAFWMALLPIYLWGYGVTILSENQWNKGRFWLGGLSGVFSVGLVYLLDILLQAGTWKLIAGIGVFLAILYGIIFFFTLIGSPFARVFLRKIALLHTVLIFFVTGITVILTHYLSGSLLVPVLLSSILLASFFEETTKHFASIGLIGKDFQFSKQDIILFTFFVAIGFVFIENILYFIRGDLSLGQWVFRSFFTLILHVFAAVVCSYFWWKALSYRLFSLRYIATFLLGFILASSIHAVYNLSLAKGNIALVFIFAAIGYIVFTRLLLEKKVSTVSQ